MSQNVNITISAKDQASQTFQAIGKSAGNMSSSVQQSAKGVDILKSAFAGLASGAALGFLADSARAAAEAEISLQRLQTAVNNTGASFEDMQPAIDDAISAAQQLAFDDETAADALATLTQYTGDTTEAIDLLGVTMDIARGRGVELTTAALAVGKAATGSTGALARMGVVVAEGASAQEALAAAQAKFAGQSEAYATTAAASADRLRTAWGNFREEIGGLAGPLTGIITLLPGMSSGFAAVGGAIGALKGAGGFAGLLAAINPVGLAVAGLALTLGGLALAFMDSKQASDDYAASLNTVEQALSDVDAEGLRTALQGLSLTLDDISGKEIGDTGDVWDKSTKAVGKYNLALAGVTDATQNSDGSLIDLSFTVSKLQEHWDTGDATLADLIATLNNYQTILNYTGDGQDIAAQSLANLTSEYTYGNMSVDDYTTAVANIVTHLSDFDRQARLNAEAIRTNATAIGQTTDKYPAWIAAQSQYNAIKDKEAAAYERSIPLIASAASHTDRYILGVDAAARAEEEHARKIEEAKQKSEELQATFTQALTPSIQGVAGAFGEVVVKGEDILDVLSRIGATTPNVNNAFADLVDGLNDSAGALDSVLGRFKTIDQLGARSEDAAQIAQNVVGDPGVYAAVDDLLNAGIITREKYDQLQRDEVAIVESNAAVQEDLNLLRTNQIDDLRNAQTEYEGYIDSLTRATEQEQTHALYLMDSANQAKVASAYSTAYAASLNEIPKEAATEIIANGAMADPVLAGILEDYGLIEMGADGTVTVNFPDASQEALNKFEAAFGEGNVTMTADGLIVVSNADGNQLVYDQFGNLVDKTVTATVTVDLNDTTGLFARGGGGVVANDVLAQSIPESATTVTVTIQADSTVFDDTLATAMTDAETFAETEYITTISGDPALWEDNISTTRDDGTAWSEETYTTTIDGDPVPWNEQLAASMSSGDEFANTTFTASIDGNRDYFDAVVSSIDGDVVGTVFMEIDGVDQNGDLAGTSSGGSGRQLGGTIRSADVSRVASVYQTAQRGRTVLVGEAGPELAFLPYGTQVMPSTPSASRARSELANGGMRFYGPVHIHAASPDIAREIERQFATRAAR